MQGSAKSKCTTVLGRKLFSSNQLGRKTSMKRMSMTCLLVALSGSVFANDADIFDEVDHHYVDNNGVNIHYVTAGEGPVVLFVHGVPEFWGTWYHQIANLSKNYKCVALDTRGYNKSDAPEGQENYTVDLVMSDMKAVLKDVGATDFTLVGHDYGGYAAWRFAMDNQDIVNKLIICNTTHLRGYQKVVREGTDAQRASVNYIHRLQEPGAEQMFNPAMMMGFVAGSEPDEVKEIYKTALANTKPMSVVNYYRELFPFFVGEKEVAMPDLTMPVLQIHGLGDSAMDKDGLRDTWNWITEDYTLVTLPGVGHFVQRESHEIVTATMRWWLDMRR